MWYRTFCTKIGDIFCPLQSMFTKFLLRISDFWTKQHFCPHLTDAVNVIQQWIYLLNKMAKSHFFMSIAKYFAECKQNGEIFSDSPWRMTSRPANVPMKGGQPMAYFFYPIRMEMGKKTPLRRK